MPNSSHAGLGLTRVFHDTRERGREAGLSPSRGHRPHSPQLLFAILRRVKGRIVKISNGLGRLLAFFCEFQEEGLAKTRNKTQRMGLQTHHEPTLLPERGNPKFPTPCTQFTPPQFVLGTIRRKIQVYFFSRGSASLRDPSA